MGKCRDHRQRERRIAVNEKKNTLFASRRLRNCNKVYESLIKIRCPTLTKVVSDLTKVNYSTTQKIIKIYSYKPLKVYKRKFSKFSESLETEIKLIKLLLKSG